MIFRETLIESPQKMSLAEPEIFIAEQPDILPAVAGQNDQLAFSFSERNRLRICTKRLSNVFLSVVPRITDKS